MKEVLCFLRKKFFNGLLGWRLLKGEKEMQKLGDNISGVKVTNVHNQGSLDIHLH
jgi:hypothetical protein